MEEEQQNLNQLGAVAPVEEAVALFGQELLQQAQRIKVAVVVETTVEHTMEQVVKV